MEYDSKEVPALAIKYDGYIERLYKMKAGSNAPTEYFTSEYLSSLKEKRNKMFSDEIIDKMVKNYDLKEYGSQVDWVTLASNGINFSKTKFSGSTPL